MEEFPPEFNMPPDLFFSKDRFEYVKSLCKRKGLKIHFKDFSAHEIYYLSWQLAFNENERKLIEMKYILCMKNSEIADSNKIEWNCLRSVATHVRDCSYRLRYGIVMMFYPQYFNTHPKEE